MPDDILLRPAEPDDAPAIAPLVVAAGGGVYQFLLDGLIPGMTAEALLMPGIAGTAGSFSHRQQVVAETGGRVVGIAHAYPVDWTRNADTSHIPADRMAHLARFQELQDWGSHFLSALAVLPSHRRRGIARRLLDATVERARRGGFDRVTLHVWADNEPARRLYAATGFLELGHAPVAWHPLLPHHGGSLLLRRSL